MTGWEYCPALDGLVRSDKPVYTDVVGPDGYETHPPSWPGEGCCEYGHTPLSPEDSVTLDHIVAAFVAAGN